MKAPLKAIVVAAVLSTAFSPLWPGVARAHGGEDHGAPPPPPTSGDMSTRSASASTSSIELVARWPAQPAATPLDLRVLISDWATNAPVEGATVTLDVTEPTGTSLPSTTLSATGSPGIYRGSVPSRVEGVHAASVTVVAGELVDVVALPALALGPATAPVESPHEHETTPSWQVIGMALLVGLLVAGAIGALLLRRRRPAAALPMVGLVVCGLVGPGVHAHGGEDHGGEDHGAPAPGSTGPARGAASTPASTTLVVLQKESQFLLGIRTTLVELAPVKDRLEVPGVVTAPPERHAAIFAPQQGRVVIGNAGRAVPLLGSTVKKGQVLAVLEAALSVSERASFAVEASQAESEVAAARSRLTAAERNLARVASLEGVVSQQDRDAAAVEVEQAQAAVAGAEGKRSAYGSTERSTRIVLEAPIGGIVADVNISPGEIVEPGRRAFLIVDPTELWVEAKVYESDLARMTPGASANIGVDAWPGRGFPGSLLALGEVIDPDTRTVKAIFKVDNPLAEGGAGRRLKLGMFAHVQIGAGESTDVLVVPDSAILDVDGRHVVFVHVEPELFERREVVPGRREGSRVEIKGGIAAGDRVATSGLLTLKNAPPAPAAAAATPPKGH